MGAKYQKATITSRATMMITRMRLSIGLAGSLPTLGNESETNNFIDRKDDTSK